MATNTKIIYNDLENSAFLLDAKRIVVDVETDTLPPDNSWTAEFGLSYCTDIFNIALYDGVNKPVVLDMPRVTGSLKGAEADLNHPKVTFIREVLSRPDIMIIGHNVIFDLRIIGGHYGFTLHPTAKVWDTQVVSIRTMMSSAGDTIGADMSQRSSLEALINRFGVKPAFSDREANFYYSMKAKYRSSFSTLSDDAKSGSIDFPELFEDGAYENVEKALVLVAHYVALDVIYCWQLYLHQSAYLTSLTKQDTKYADLSVPRWDNVLDLVKGEVYLSAQSANQAIRGVRFNLDYANELVDKYSNELDVCIDNMLKLRTPFQTPLWEYKAALIYWYNCVMDTLSTGVTYSAIHNKPYLLQALEAGKAEHSDSANYDKNRVAFVRSLLTPPDDYMSYSASYIDNWLDEWATFLGNLPTTSTRNYLFKNAPQSPRPNLLSWDNFIFNTVVSQYSHLDKYNRDLRVGLLSDYYLYLFKSSTNFGRDIINKNKYKPYYIFVVCEIMLPSDHDIEYNWDLVTDKVLDAATEWRRNRNRPDPDMEYMDTPPDNEIFNWVEYALSVDGFSTGKAALNFYLPKPLNDDGTDNEAFTNHKGHWYRLALQYEAWLNRIQEFKLHALRDGRIHSVISRLTRTGRFSSTNPNLQNIDMNNFKGLFIGDEGYVLVEADYANAENKTGAMISGDNAFAQATEGGDFHTAQMEIYWGDEVKRLREAGDKAGLKKLRTKGKGVTFGSAYGAGAYKIAVMLRSDLSEAKRILTLKDSAYPLLTKRKEEAGNAIVARAKAGYTPTYVSLWNGARVVAAYTRDEATVNSVRFRVWNYLQQGGVAEMVSKAIVAISNWLYENNFKTYIALNVHDSIIFNLFVGEEDLVLPKIFEIMGEQVNVELRRRTRPFIHFVSEVGPENAIKWGYVPNQEYPLSLEHFWNRWGKHKLSDEQLKLPTYKREAETWVVDLSVGDSLEKEMSRTLVEERLSSVGVDITANNRWSNITKRYEELVNEANEKLQKSIDLSFMKASYMLVYKDANGLMREVGPLDFTNFMNAIDYLCTRGYDRKELTHLPTWEEVNEMLSN